MEREGSDYLGRSVPLLVHALLSESHCQSNYMQEGGSGSFLMRFTSLSKLCGKSIPRLFFRFGEETLWLIIGISSTFFLLRKLMLKGHVLEQRD